MKDSGKGDSDFNDSDSDSGQAGRKIATIGHQRASSKFYFLKIFLKNLVISSPNYQAFN